MCGIWGFSGKPGNRINLDKLIILGMFNESRGKDSCGYYFNGNIEKGVHQESDFSEFISKNKLTPGTLKAKTFMGHTRKGTYGIHNLENAHPHVVSNNYVQTHNGTIKDIWPLCTKYNIHHGNIHCDSIGLAHLIAKVGPKILAEYQGYAALAFTYMDNPEALYLFHGMSKETMHGPLVAERPLFYLKQPEGIYYSSMEESLLAINVDPKISVYNLKYNIVFEIVSGDFTDRQFSVDRINSNIGITSHYALPAAKINPNNADNYQSSAKYSHKNTMPLPEEDVNENDLILEETHPNLEFAAVGKVFYHKGRFYKLGLTPATGTYYDEQLNGTYIINRAGFIVSKSLDSQLGHQEHKYYFINGIMIRSESSYKHLMKDCVQGHTDSTFKRLSFESPYPIIQLESPTTMTKCNSWWYHNGAKVKKSTFSPKFSRKTYILRKGTTLQIYENDNV